MVTLQSHLDSHLKMLNANTSWLTLEEEKEKPDHANSYEYTLHLIKPPYWTPNEPYERSYFK